MSIFQFSDYRSFLKSLIASREGGGRGEYRRIANFLNVHTTLVSQVFNGLKNFTVEQAFELSEYFSLNERESKYLLLMVQRERSGTHRLKMFYQSELEKLSEESREIKNNLPKSKILNGEDKALFYSNYLYSAVKILSSLNEFNTVDDISRYLNVPPRKIIEIVDFLLKNGLCLSENGKLSSGVSRTHLERTSSLVFNHHINWRQRVIQKYPSFTSEDFSFTAPLTISRDDFSLIREDLLKFISSLGKVVEHSQGEKAVCLNIDFFQF